MILGYNEFVSQTAEQIACNLGRIVGEEKVLHGSAVERVYSSDAYTVERFPPTVVALPTSTEDIAEIVRFCREHDLPFTPRGAGTGLSGGAMPALGGAVISTKKLTAILDFSIEDQWLHAQSGIANLKITKKVEPFGYHFAPDPSSQSVSTLGGNIAMNSGGPHTLKYGVTAQHILGLRYVNGNGEIITIGGPAGQQPGYDLLSLLIGSEGTLGIVTEAWVKLTKNPSAICTASTYFSTIEDASKCVGAMVRSGVMPAALEMMDHYVLAAVAAAYPIHVPKGTAAMLLIETDGEPESAKSDIDELISIAEQHNSIETALAKNQAERTLLWTARKKGVGALGRLAPTVVTHDGVIPPSRLPEMLEAVYAVVQSQNIGVANIFHAGDGNLHPIFYFDEREPGAIDRVVKAGEMVIEKCLELGGSVTGEHGIGVEKTDLLAKMYSANSLAFQARLRDVFGSPQSCNPCKVIPSGKGCLEHKVRWRGVAT
ncbi:MAG: FAD-binding protein [Fimbriimonadaceae bacterium]|nr:MAG: FAD-binding protein [Fimbriimonadaceae bacterium]